MVPSGGLAQLTAGTVFADLPGRRHRQDSENRNSVFLSSQPGEADKKEKTVLSFFPAPNRPDQYNQLANFENSALKLNKIITILGRI